MYHQLEFLLSSLNVKRELNCSTLSSRFPNLFHRTRVAIRVRHPLGHNWVRAILQKERNFKITLGIGNLSPACKMVEFRATYPTGKESAWLESSGIIIIIELGISYLARELANISAVTTGLYELAPYSKTFPSLDHRIRPPLLTLLCLIPCWQGVLNLLG